MSGIKMSDCRFYVDEDARTVVCVIPNTQNMVLDFVRDNCDYSNISLYDSINFWNHKIVNDVKLPNSFMGKAVCSEEDEWDEELGRMIAFSRAKNKCYKSFFKRANMLVQAIDRRLGDMINSFNDFGLKLEDKREALEAKIEERTKKEGDA